MELLSKTCKACKITHTKAMPYCSIECVNADEEFHEICRTSRSLLAAAKKCGMSETTFRRVTKELGIKIVRKKKILPVKICPKCGKEHTSKYGIHCSKSCANSRTHLEETKKKMSKSKKEFYKNNLITETIRKNMSESRKKFYESEENRKKTSELMKEFYASEKAEETIKKQIKARKEFHKNNPMSEEKRKQQSEIMKKYYKKHPKKLKTEKEKKAQKLAHNAIRRARKKNALSPDADRKLLAKIREHCPEGYHIDHIIPINKGGLEHQDNLQYLPAFENLKKKDRLDYEPQGAIRWQDVVPQ